MEEFLLLKTYIRFGLQARAFRCPWKKIIVTAFLSTRGKNFEPVVHPPTYVVTRDLKNVWPSFRGHQKHEVAQIFGPETPTPNHLMTIVPLLETVFAYQE